MEMNGEHSEWCWCGQACGMQQWQVCSKCASLIMNLHQFNMLYPCAVMVGNVGTLLYMKNNWEKTARVGKFLAQDILPCMSLLLL
jgi:hypothetical protein